MILRKIEVLICRVHSLLRSSVRHRDLSSLTSAKSEVRQLEIDFADGGSDGRLSVTSESASPSRAAAGKLAIARLQALHCLGYHHSRRVRFRHRLNCRTLIPLIAKSKDLRHALTCGAHNIHRCVVDRHNTVTLPAGLP